MITDLDPHGRLCSLCDVPLSANNVTIQAGNEQDVPPLCTPCCQQLIDEHGSVFGVSVLAWQRVKARGAKA